MSSSANQKLFPVLEAQPSASFQNQLKNYGGNEDIHDRHPEAVEFNRPFTESLDGKNQSYEAVRVVMKMSLEKMDKILAIVEAMRRDREELEKRWKELAQENDRTRKKLLRQARRRARRT